jgi:succinate dehydrogenase / fumarate reductase membrane anchor subunit
MTYQEKKSSDLGSAGNGVKHWLHQRFSAVFLLLFTYWIFAFSMDIMNANIVGVIDVVKRPLNLIMLLIFVVTSFYHGSLGLQVVIEDYIHHRFLRLCALLFVQIFSVMTVTAFLLSLLYLINL